MSVSIPFIAGQWSLLLDVFQTPGWKDDVSIPFIAGQWSLLSVSAQTASGPTEFQSPSLRGSGRFSMFVLGLFSSVGFQSPSLRGSGRFARKEAQNVPVPIVFQSPSLRGSGRFARRRAPGRAAWRVSIPFIAGQWSLQNEVANRRFRGIFLFQSPSLRGSGRFGKEDE